MRTLSESQLLHKAVVEKISHDIRNPFSAVYGYLHLAVEKNPAINQHPRVLNRLRRKIEKISEIFKGLTANLDLELSQKKQVGAEQNQTFRVQMQACDTSRRIHQLVTEIHSEVSRRNQEHSTDRLAQNPEILTVLLNASEGIHHAVLATIQRKHKPINLNRLMDKLEGVTHVHIMTRPVTVMGDASKLLTAMTNILANAKDFERSGIQPLRLATLQVFPDKPDEVHLHFLDHGQGIHPEVLPHVFDYKFTTRQGKGGTGLGLDTARHIIEEEHGGKISAASEYGQWTNFHVILPIHTPEKNDAK